MNNIPRIALIASLAFLLVRALPLCADDKTAASIALLERARALEDLRADGGTPFTLSARITTTSGKEQSSGAYALTWIAANHWRETLSLADFSRLRAGVDGGYRQVRTWDYQPMAIFDIDRLLDVAAIVRLHPEDVAERIRSRKVNGVQLSCVEIRAKDGPRREACFDPGTGLLAHAESLASSEGATIDYTGVVVAGDRRLPSQLRLTKPGGYSIEISVSNIEVIAANASVLPVPDPATSEFWGACRDVVRPQIVPRVAPHYPEAAKQNHEQGAVYVYARIEPDGTVSHLRTLESPSAALATASVEALAHWTYSPASCHGVPVRFETVVHVVFSIRN